MGRKQNGNPRREKEVVVLIHGLAANRWMMKPLERTIRRTGFRTHNWGYQSVRRDIDAYAEQLRSTLREFEQEPGVDRVRLVTHSMGGIVARRALTADCFPKVRSLVMLGPPNQGSRVAGLLAPVLGWFCKPLAQLSAAAISYVNQLPVPEGLEIGVIAAGRDRVVAIENTHLPNEIDHCVVPCGHTSLLFRRDVADRVASFLQSSQFEVASTATGRSTNPVAGGSSSPAA